MKYYLATFTYGAPLFLKKISRNSKTGKFQIALTNTPDDAISCANKAMAQTECKMLIAMHKRDDFQPLSHDGYQAILKAKKVAT